MFIAYQFRERGSAVSELQSRVIAGTQWELAISQDHADGPFYPQVIENDHDDDFRFFAGRVVGHLSAMAPAVAPFSFATDADPDGSWIALEFEKSTDTLKIASDVFNVQRWFYCRNGKGWIVANSLRYLARVATTKPAIDERAIPYLLRMGYVPEPFTPLRDVFSLGTGQQITFSRSESQLVERAVLPVHRRQNLVTKNIGEQLSHVLIDEVAQQIRGLDQMWIPLSGGIDSRFLLACALNTVSPEKISTVTFGSSESLDVKIGSALAKRCGVRNIVLPMDARPLSEIVDQNFAVAEGLYWTVPDYPVQSFNDTLPPNSIALSGFVGDPVFGSKEGKLSIHEMAVGREEELIKFFWKSGTYVSPELIAPLLNMGNDDPLQVSEIFRNIPGLSMMERFDNWYFGQHSVNRTLFAVTPARRNVFYVTPFISRAVLDTAFAMPTEMRKEQRAYFAALKSGFPDFYAYPTTRNHGFPLAERRTLNLTLTRWRRGLLRELDERLGDRFGWHLFHSPRANYSHPRELLKPSHRDEVIAAVERLRSLPIMQGQQLDKINENIARGYGVDPQLLRGLITVSQWVKAFQKVV